MRSTIASISTRPPFGSAATAKQERAGNGAGTKVFMALLTASKLAMSVREDRYFDDIGHRETGFRDDCTQILEGLRCLFFNAVSQFPVAGSMPSCPRAVKRNLREGALAVRTNGGGSVIRLNDTVGHLSSPLIGASESIWKKVLMLDSIDFGELIEVLVMNVVKYKLFMTHDAI